MGHMQHTSFISTVRMHIPHIVLVKLLETSIVFFTTREKSSYHAENINTHPPTQPTHKPMHTAGNPELKGHSEANWPGRLTMILVT